MNHKIIFLAFLPLLWTRTSGEQWEPRVKTVSGKIDVFCQGSTIKLSKDDNTNLKEKEKLDYKDKFSGEYICMNNDNDPKKTKIFVKLRTCDNCIQLDTGSIAGIAVGEIVATVVLGVAVYLVASQARSGSVTSNKQSSDRQHLVSNEVSHRPNNDHYQPLRFPGGQKDTYDVVSNKK